MWKSGGESDRETSNESMEVVPSQSYMEVRSADFTDGSSHHSLPDDGSETDPLNFPTTSSQRSSSSVLLPGDVADLRQRSTPNIFSWVAEQQQITMRINNALATRRPQSVSEGRRLRPEDYEKAAEEIKRVRRQCGM